MKFTGHMALGPSPNSKTGKAPFKRLLHVCKSLSCLAHTKYSLIREGKRMEVEEKLF